MGIKVRRARSIHPPIICFEPCLYMVCYVIINKNNDKRKKKGNTRKRWVVFKLLYYFVKKKEVSLSKICSIRLMKFRIFDENYKFFYKCFFIYDVHHPFIKEALLYHSSCKISTSIQLTHKISAP